MKRVALIILDGFGYREEKDGNAILAADPKNYMSYWHNNPHTLLDASGKAVDLPDGQMGNSEVGHLNIGSGRVPDQALTIINRSIKAGDFYSNEVLNAAIDNCIKNGTSLHIMGLYSPGGVHSHSEHIKAIIELARRRNFSRVYLHCFLDGRDTPPMSAKEYIADLSAYLKGKGVGKIATISGRYYAMDRDMNYTRVQLAFDAMVLGRGETFSDPLSAIQASYDANVTDEFIVPTVILENGTPVASIQPNDSVIFANYRADRAMELAKAFLFAPERINAEQREKAEKTEKETGKKTMFTPFVREASLPLYFAALAQYDDSIDKLMHIAYPDEILPNVLSKYLSDMGYNQLHIAETEKFAHVTFFFNGRYHHPVKGEYQYIVPSDQSTGGKYNLIPKMCAERVADDFVALLNSGNPETKEPFDFFVLNFANPDMVGHSGEFGATVEAVKAVDNSLKTVVDALTKAGVTIMITADHGNAEYMTDKQNGKPFTAHTTSKVPFILMGESNVKSLREGALCDIATTILDIMNLPEPKEMTGKTLINR